jgi:hypothetical protein
MPLTFAEACDRFARERAPLLDGTERVRLSPGVYLRAQGCDFAVEYRTARRTHVLIRLICDRTTILRGDAPRTPGSLRALNAFGPPGVAVSDGGEMVGWEITCGTGHRYAWADGVEVEVDAEGTTAAGRHWRAETGAAPAARLPCHGGSDVGLTSIPWCRERTGAWQARCRGWNGDRWVEVCQAHAERVTEHRHDGNRSYEIRRRPAGGGSGVPWHTIAPARGSRAIRPPPLLPGHRAPAMLMPGDADYGVPTEA